MGIIEWLLAAVVGTNVSILLVTLQIFREQQRSNKQTTALWGLLTSRQTYTRQARSSRQSPGVDAKARTTRRDTSDIPVRGGTQRPLKFKQVGGPNVQQQED